MALPASFARDGFLSPSALRSGKLRGLMIGIEGWAGSGKTEFAFSAPGPGIEICLDRGIDSILDNPNPPATRRDDFAIKLISRLMPTQATQPDYVKDWKAFYAEWVKALNNQDARTVALDTDSDSWELQRLAEFGQIQGVMSLRYAGINAARKAMLARAYDSGKIVIGLNRLEEEYETQVVGNKDVQVKTGRARRQGNKDYTYLWSLQLRCMFKDGQYGVEIMLCKADSSLQGLTLWGDDCNMPTLLQTVYPKVDLKSWGY